MKKFIITRLILVVFIGTLAVMALSASLLLKSAEDNFKVTAQLQIKQIVELLQQNSIEIDRLKEDLNEDFFIRTEMLDYILYTNPEVLYNVPEMQRIGKLLQVDQIHIFDKDGVIFAGTLPDFYGFTLRDGEQIAFFLPMLEDKNLRLAQDVTVNSGQNKEMQYFAIWSEDKEYIVQIGIDPIRLRRAMQETELQYIFSRLAPSPDVTIFALSAKSKHIVSSTNVSIIGKNISDIEVVASALNASDVVDGKNFRTRIDETVGQSLFQYTDELIIGVFEPNSSIYKFAFSNIIFVIISCLLVGTLLMICIYFMLDRVVLNKLFQLRDGMNKITKGDLEYKMQVQGLSEFESLSHNINLMVQSVINSSKRFSTIFQYVNLPLAVYEHRADVIYATSKLGEILDVSMDERGEKIAVPQYFLKRIQEIMAKPYLEEDVFIFEHRGKTSYLKIKLYSEQDSDWGIILDITDEINEKQHIKFERDMDYLTGIYNRRAFLEQITTLIEQPETVGNAVLLMLDLDNLKFVNDSWGHAYGDAFITKAAEVIKDFPFDGKITARLSGDEFVLLLYGDYSYEELEQSIQDLHQLYKNTFIEDPKGAKYPVTLSGGYVFCPKHSSEVKELLQLADSTMYKAKETKKGSFLPYGKAL